MITKTLSSTLMKDSTVEHVLEALVQAASNARWISYHQIFNHIVNSHGVMVWLNLVFLFFITLIPFAVDLQVDYSSYQIIFILYALVLTAAGLSLTLIWLHASKNRLVDKSPSHTEIQSILLES